MAHIKERFRSATLGDASQRNNKSNDLVVKAKYRHNAEPEEEYIDLKPILDGLYIDYDSFLKPIKSVRITYA